MHPTLTPASKPVLNLPTLEDWKADMAYVVGYIARWFTCQQQTVTHPSSKRARCQLTTLIEANALTTALSH